MRIRALIAAFIATASMLCAGPASAQPFAGQSVLFGRTHVYRGAWCANINSGPDRVEEDCSFDSFEACQRSLMNGNFGFCTQSRAYAGRAQSPIRKTKKKRRGSR